MTLALVHLRLANLLPSEKQTGRFPDANNQGERWFIRSTEKAENLADAIKRCAKEKGHSLFLSAVESDNAEMINSVGEGIVYVFKDPKVSCATSPAGSLALLYVIL